jgi:hypothetical protein
MSIKIKRGTNMEKTENVETLEQAEEKAIQKIHDEFIAGRVDAVHCFKTPPPRRDFVFNGLRIGKVGCLYAPGATSKSYLSLQAAISVVLGADLLGIDPTHQWFNKERRGKVIYLSTEDDAEELHHRLSYLLKVHPRLAEFEDFIRENLFIIDMTGQENLNVLDKTFYSALCRYTDNVRQGRITADGEIVDPAPVVEGEEKTEFPLRLVVFDTLSQFHVADENQNKEMKPVINRFKKYAKKKRTAVLYLHHNAKQAALGGHGKKQQSARGASCIIDDARWGGYLQKVDLGPTGEWRYMVHRHSGRPVTQYDFPELKNCVLFGDGKINSGRETEVLLERDEKGVLMPCQKFMVINGDDRVTRIKSDEAQKISEEIKAKAKIEKDRFKAEEDIARARRKAANQIQEKAEKLLEAQEIFEKAMAALSSYTASGKIDPATLEKMEKEKDKAFNKIMSKLKFLKDEGSKEVMVHISSTEDGEASAADRDGAVTEATASDAGWKKGL